MKPAAEEPPKAHIAVAAVDHLRLACLMARILPRLSTSQHVAADAQSRSCGIGGRCSGQVSALHQQVWRNLRLGLAV